MIETDSKIDQFPFIWDHDDAMDIDTFTSFFKQNEKEIDGILLKNGAIKFRGIIIEDVDAFQKTANRISEKFLPYVDGNSPRTKLTSHVYTSTEYDKEQKITMHNELSYSSKWPGKLFFSCLVPAKEGGETLIADSREILRSMDPHIVSEVEKRGVAYIRNLHEGKGFDLPGRKHSKQKTSMKWKGYATITIYSTNGKRMVVSG